MSQINVGIIGYGNLGKAVEEILRTRKEFKIVAIFSKRKFVKSQYEVKVDRLDNLEKYKDKIDLLFLCAGSYDGVEKIGNEIIKDYSFIDSFDTHSKLYDYISKLDLIAKERETVCLNACGWDPGILSLVRLLFNSISPSYFTANCFWGSGVSQGHSQAIRQISGVENAIQYTIPYKAIIKKCKKLCDYTPDSTVKHTRLCFVSVSNNIDKQKIKDEIVNIPNYFKGYKTIVKFVSNKKILDKQKKLYHKGIVIRNFEILDKFKTQLEFRLNTKSNPHFTAEIMIMGALAVYKLKQENKFGAYSLFDIPLKYLTNCDYEKIIKSNL